MFEIHFSKYFLDEQKKLTEKDDELKARIVKSLILLSQNPKHPSLKTHKVQTKSFGIKFSSWITGDYRIIREFDQQKNLVILILDIGGHSGNHKVYN